MQPTLIVIKMGSNNSECAGRTSIYARHLGSGERGCLGGRQVYGLLRLRVAALPWGPLPWQKSAKPALLLHCCTLADLRCIPPDMVDGFGVLIHSMGFSMHG